MAQKRESTDFGLDRLPKLTSSNRSYYFTVAGVAITYFAAAKLGLSLASIHVNVSPVWPPAGIAIAAVLLFGYRIWPGVLVAAFLANFLLTETSLAVSGAIAAGNTLEALAAGFLLRPFDFHKTLDRANDVFKLVLVVLLSTMVAATVGNVSLCLSHAARWDDFGSLWLTWWLGDTTGALVVAPLLLTWGAGSRFRLPRKRYLEGILVLLLLTISAIPTFGGESPISLRYYPLVRLTIPFFLWAAFRLGQPGVTLANIGMSVVAIWGTTGGFGPFVGGDSNDALLRLQVFLASSAVTFLILAAAVEERRRSEDTLRESERRLAANLGITRILAESPAAETAIPRILQTIGESLGWEVGAVWVPDADGKRLRCLNLWHTNTANVENFKAFSYEHRFPPGIGLPGRVWTSLEPAWIDDVTQDRNFPRGSLAAAEGLHGAFAFPILFGDEFLGVMEFFSPEIRKPNDSLLQMFNGIGSQIGQFLKRKGAEEALEITSRLPKENPSPVLRLDHRGVITFANPAAERVLAAWGLITGEKAPAKIAEPARQALEEGEKRQLELAQGNQTYVLNIAPVPHANYVNLYFSEITDRKRAEEALRESERQLRLALEAASMGPWEYEIQSGKVTWSRSLELIHGLEPGSFGGTIDDYQADIHPDDRQIVFGSLARTIEGGSDHEIEYRIVLPDGTVRWVEGKGQVIRDATGNAVRMVGVCMDITERKRSEAEREKLLSNEQAARAEAEAANRTKDDFLALLSHELRTPLVAIVGWASTLTTPPYPDEAVVARALEVIKRNAILQTRIIDDMLDVSRIVSGKLELDPRPVDLASVVEAAILTVQPTADAKGVQLELVLDPSSTNPVLGDPQRLQQVVWNLLSNAIKFTPGGGRVQITLTESDQKAQITVSDTGEGIPKEFLPHIFDRFRQADSSTTRKHGGLGLGLAIVRHLVELQKGTVAAYSAGQNQGAVFTITLPLMVENADEPVRQSRFDRPKTRDNALQLSGLRILYVEDDIDSREALTAVLSMYGAEVRAAATVTEALNCFTEWQPDVILSDIGMPDLNGYDLIREIRLREAKDGGAVPAIALTGYVGTFDGAHALAAGFQRYVAKPIEPARLAEIISSLARGTTHSQTTAAVSKESTV